jgi:diguanylate cyclase (GGDEF)-like protein
MIKLFGTADMEFSHRITIIVTIAVGIIVSMIGAINALLGYSLASVLGAFGLGLISFVLYGFLLKGRFIDFARWFVPLLFVMVVAPYFWIVDGGTMGGFQYFFPTYIVASAILLRKFGSKRVLIVVILNAIVLAIMLWVEYNNPDIIQVNPMRGARLFDMGFSIWLAGFGSFLMIMSALRAYEQEKEKVERLTIVDDLTQAYNRRYMTSKIQEEIDRVDRYREPGFSIILLDIDKFKSVNDTYGHDVGDQALIHLSGIIKDGLRKSDKFARWGGEEFVIFLAQTSIDGAKIVADRFREIVASTPVNEYLTITFSAGVSHYKDGDDVELITKRADKALYASKENGRNQVTVLD